RDQGGPSRRVQEDDADISIKEPVTRLHDLLRRGPLAHQDTVSVAGKWSARSVPCNHPRPTVANRIEAKRHNWRRGSDNPLIPSKLREVGCVPELTRRYRVACNIGGRTASIQSGCVIGSVFRLCSNQVREP